MSNNKHAISRNDNRTLETHCAKCDKHIRGKEVTIFKNDDGWICDSCENSLLQSKFLNILKSLVKGAEFIETDAKEIDISGKVFKNPLVIICRAGTYINGRGASFTEGVIAIGYKGHKVAPSCAGFTGNVFQPVVDFINGLDWPESGLIPGVTLDIKYSNNLFSDPEDIKSAKEALVRFNKN